MRTKLQSEEPDIGFGDLGRRLGEMWHSLKEEEKEDYRFRPVGDYAKHFIAFQNCRFFHPNNIFS